MIDDVMRELERDATPESAALITGLAAEYFDVTRRGEGPVSSGIAPNEIEARFYIALIEYALAVKNVHYEKGSLLDYNEITLAEGGWPTRTGWRTRCTWDIRCRFRSPRPSGPTQ